MSKLKEGDRVRALHGRANLPETVWGKTATVFKDRDCGLFTVVFDSPDKALHNGGLGRKEFENRAWHMMDHDIEKIDAPPKFKGGEIVRVQRSYPTKNMPTSHGFLDLDGMKGRIHTVNGKPVIQPTGSVLVKFPKPHPSLHDGQGRLDKRQGWYIHQDHLKEVPSDDDHAVILEKLGE